MMNMHFTIMIDFVTWPTFPLSIGFVIWPPLEPSLSCWTLLQGKPCELLLF